ncbi:hypothetical protein HOF56_00805 [Candidatus Peribacteria bacterium]|jgi:hypothetical protein|nr:hypothetical protein [Candidatus Peribacteria bacterium]MBT4021358.1 hypothetical protein [Candidatus Peribacteria bacterium]MBT4241252.1 hypothetical protein [Candidatus Peribacteria bacterium]MBT4474277.1 hypothetical protein [Candidatus Peribacteria bacterium]
MAGFLDLSGFRRAVRGPRSAVSLLCLFLVLSACSGDVKNTVTPSDVFGAYTATGTVTSTGTSLYRRGTHVLKMNGRSRFYLESKKVNLSDYIGEYAVLEGEMSPNSHEKYLPVISVSSIKNASRKNVGIQKYKVASLNISLEAPSEWNSDISGGKLKFSFTGERVPFVTIKNSDLEKLPEGLHLRVDGRNGIRFVDEEANQHHVYIRRDNGEIIEILFVPQGEKSALSRDAFYSMIKSLEIEDEEIVTDENEENPEDIGSLQPCGGSAAVICPEGEYCAVEELDTGIGKCKTLISDPRSAIRDP